LVDSSQQGMSYLPPNGHHASRLQLQEDLFQA